jgi:hypothetical protein
MPSHPAKEPKLRIPTFFSPFFTLCSSTFAVAAVEQNGKFGFNAKGS